LRRSGRQWHDATQDGVANVERLLGMSYIGIISLMNIGRVLGYGLLALQGWESQHSHL
jgi:hypothetical protein